MKRCPKCGAETFYVTAHVTQDWKVDTRENWMETMNDCVEVTHFADDADIWECANCEHSDIGIAFNVKEVENQ